MKDAIIRNDSDKRRNFPITVTILDEGGNKLEEVHCEAVKLDAEAMTLYMHRARTGPSTCDAQVSELEYCDWEGWFVPAASFESPPDGDEIGYDGIRLED